MAYYPYQGTMAALSGVGESLNRLSELDAARKMAAMEHELNMKRLDIGRETTEAQNRLGLLTTERGIEAQKAESAYRMAELGQRTRLTDKQIEALDLQQKREDWLSEGGAVGTLWRGSMTKQGIPQDEQNATIANFIKHSGGYGEQVLATPTLRSRLYDVLENMPRMMQAEALRQRALGNPGSASNSASNKVIRKEADDFVGILNKMGDVDLKDPMIQEQFDFFENAGYPIIQTKIQGIDETTQRPIIKAGYRVHEIPPQEAMERRGRKLGDEWEEKHINFTRITNPELKQYLIGQYMQAEDTGDVDTMKRIKLGLSESRNIYPGADRTKPPFTNPATVTSPATVAPVEQKRIGYFSEGGGGIPGMISDIPGVAQRTTQTAGAAIYPVLTSVVPPARSAFNTMAKIPGAVAFGVDRAFPQVQRNIFPALEEIAVSDFAKYPFGKEWALTPVESDLMRRTIVRPMGR